MAVRTRVAGIKNRRLMPGVDEAQTNQQGIKTTKTVPRDQAAGLRRQKLMKKATPGPAMVDFNPGRGEPTTEVRPGKRTASRRKLKRGNS